MRFNPNSQFAGKHAFLSASSPQWLSDDEDKLLYRYNTSQMARMGTQRHALAAELIRQGVKLPDTAETFNSYVNDAIGFMMTPEQTLVYSRNAYGTADAVSFDIPKMFLRIHDLKMGRIQASFRQLHVYAGFFCLEYDVLPVDIQTELRIYQNDEIRAELVDPIELTRVVSSIKRNNELVDEWREAAM